MRYEVDGSGKICGRIVGELIFSFYDALEGSECYCERSEQYEGAEKNLKK